MGRSAEEAPEPGGEGPVQRDDGVGRVAGEQGPGPVGLEAAGHDRCRYRQLGSETQRTQGVGHHLAEWRAEGEVDQIVEASDQGSEQRPPRLGVRAEIGRGPVEIVPGHRGLATVERVGHRRWRNDPLQAVIGPRDGGHER